MPCKTDEPTLTTDSLQTLSWLELSDGSDGAGCIPNEDLVLDEIVGDVVRVTYPHCDCDALDCHVGAIKSLFVPGAASAGSESATVSAMNADSRADARGGP